MRSHDELVKIIDDLKDFGDYCLRWGNDLRGNLLKIAAETIAELEHEHAETSLEMQRQMCRADGGVWIPCAKRLPDPGHSVIIAGKMKYGWEKEYERFVDVATYTTEERFETFNDWYEGQQEFAITHWMPLPDPPKEVEA